MKYGVGILRNLLKNYNMFRILRGISEYLHIKHVGLLELLFSFTPMLSGFSLYGLPLSVLMWALLLAIIFIQHGKLSLRNFVPLTLFAVYWVVHTVVIMIYDDVNLNGFIAQLLYFFAVYALYPNMDSKKLKGSLNWVAIIAMGGLLYQWTFVLRGEMVHPLEIPGLEMSDERLEQLNLRPSSFFMEPAAYVAFMVCPLAFSLIERKFIWAGVLILSIYLTTSTTGLVGSFIMLGASLIRKERNLKSYVWNAILGGVLFYSLFNFDVFEYGVTKFENTDTETNVRLVQGRYVVSTMRPSEYYFGAPYSTAYNYSLAGRAPDVVYYGKTVYMSTFWLMILLYGVIGLLLYLNIYFQILRKNWRTLPLIAFMFAVMFSGGYGVGTGFVFTLVVLLCMVGTTKCEKEIV